MYCWKWFSKPSLVVIRNLGHICSRIWEIEALSSEDKPNKDSKLELCTIKDVLQSRSGGKLYLHPELVNLQMKIVLLTYINCRYYRGNVGTVQTSWLHKLTLIGLTKNIWSCGSHQFCRPGNCILNHDWFFKVSRLHPHLSTVIWRKSGSGTALMMSFSSILVPLRFTVSTIVDHNVQWCT